MGITERKKVIITPTTHWDREWVMTFGQFQVRLVNLMDNLLKILDNCPEYKFLLDGQSVIIEDYLEIKPENRDRLCRYLKEGRLIAGPWYVLADQFLENAESAIRNLMIGIKTVKEYNGQPMMMGYVPDSFGSLASLPTLLSGFGIKYATFSHGRPGWDESLPTYEFIWEGPDNSQIIAANFGYGNGLFLSYLDIWSNIQIADSSIPDPEKALTIFMDAAKSQSEKLAGKCLYFSVGADHMEARESLPRVVDYINKNQDEYWLEYGTPLDYTKSIEEVVSELKTYRGEMRKGGKNRKDLGGSLSSRIHIKQKNDCCEILLQRAVEPLWTMASALLGVEYPYGFISKIWKLIIINHPHDSICACHLDQVTRDIMNRYEQAEEMCRYLIKDGIHHLSQNIDTRTGDETAVAIIVFNPLGNKYTGPVKGIVRVPKRFNFDDYCLINELGEIIPAKIRHIADKRMDLESVYMTNQMLSELLSKNADYETPYDYYYKKPSDEETYTVLEIEFVAENIPDNGWKTLSLKPLKPSQDAGNGVNLNENGIENQYIRVELNANGTFDLFDKATGHSYNGLNYFADREDTGNCYEYTGFDKAEQLDTRESKALWSVFENEGFKITYEANIPFEIPAEIVSNRRAAEKKPLYITTHITLYAGVPRLDITVEFKNKSKDHCIKAVFDTDINTDVVSAYDHFNVIDREVRKNDPEWWDNPFGEFVDISDGSKGLCLSSKGLPSYDAAKGTGVSLYLTLLRSVGNIGSAAGANYPTPDAQCLGKQRFEYSIFPHKGNWLEGDCLNIASAYRTPIILEADLQHGGQLPPSGSFINIFPQSGIKPFISCLKQAETGTESVFRIWNPQDSVEMKLNSSFEVSDIQRTNFDETVKNTEKTIIDNEAFAVRGKSTETFKMSIRKG